MDSFSRSQLLKELVNTQYTIVEYPSLLLYFLPTGVLQILGANKQQPIIHRYSLIHNGEDWILSVSPHILNTPSDMKLMIMKNHVTLTSIKDPNEIIHLTRLKVKSY